MTKDEMPDAEQPADEVVRSAADDQDLQTVGDGDATSSRASELTKDGTSGSLVGSRLGDFQVMRKLGRGGMADVYAARQLSLARDVAFKILRPDYARDKDYIHRFRREARAAAKLNHQNIVQVYEVGNVD